MTSTPIIKLTLDRCEKWVISGFYMENLTKRLRAARTTKQYFIAAKYAFIKPVTNSLNNTKYPMLNAIAPKILS